jgi:hypothetical protein
MEPRDAMAQPATPSGRTRDEYPIRQSWTFVVPTPSAAPTVTYKEK